MSTISSSRPASLGIIGLTLKSAFTIAFIVELTLKCYKCLETLKSALDSNMRPKRSLYRLVVSVLWGSIVLERGPVVDRLINKPLSHAKSLQTQANNNIGT